MLRKSFAAVLGGVALLATLFSAQAQVNVVPQQGLITGFLTKTSYSAAFFGLVPVVTAATDQVCIAGSATKTIKVQRITINGTTTTAAQVVPINLVRRVSADTGGTAASTTANPANTIAKRDVNSPAATATVVAYTAAPTIVDTSPTYIDTKLMAMPLGLVSTQGPGIADFNFSQDLDKLVQVPTLVGAAAQLCVSNGSALTNASVWNGTIVWTEE